MTDSTLVYGVAIAGQALTEALLRRGDAVVLADDNPSAQATDWASRHGLAINVGQPIHNLLDGITQLCPAPGVPEDHPVIVAAQAAGIAIRTEIDLAYEWEQRRSGGPRPILAVTGTDGKTTTTLMAAHMLNQAGRRAVAVGNTEVPFVAELDSDAQVFVVECSSFRLNWLEHFRAEASVWLNFAPDHQNWHTSLESYRAAKERMWANARSTDVAIGFADDDVVIAALRRSICRQVTFGLDSGDYRLDDATLIGPRGPITRRDEMSRDLPHDITNALAAAALVIESGLAASDDVAAALATFRHPEHRIEPVGGRDGVRWFNDSKATSPHAALTAIRSFERVVLIAGGKNKDLDLTQLASEPQRMVGVVAIGAASAEVAAAFAGICPVEIVPNSMADAVRAAAALALPGDVVLLSPACASFDWYSGGYPARGADFKRLVAELILQEES